LIGLSVLGVLSVLYLYFLVQLRANDFESGNVIGEGFRSYFFSHLATFSAWLDAERLSPSPLGFGQYSFSGLLGRLGIAERQAGIYESVTMPKTGDLSNLFTAFRGVIQDFGGAGAALIMLALGFGSQWVYARTQAGSLRAASVLAVVYFACLLSFLYSPFIFNNIILACLIFALLKQALLEPPAEPVPA
jgi:hypothetical protein